MKSKEFLKERLFRIFSSINNLNIRYQHLKENSLHLIQITSLQDKPIDTDFDELQLQLIRDFRTNFPAESVMFCDDESNLKITSPEFSFSKVAGKSVIETRSFRNYSPSFTLMVTEDPGKFRSL